MTTTAQLTRAEDAYAHLASFQRGDKVDVGGRSFYLPGTVTTAQRDGSRATASYLTVTGTATVGDGITGWHEEAVEVKVTVSSLLSGRFTITPEAGRGTGNVRYFDAAAWAMQNEAA